ncbi:MAG: phosphatidylglycerophosphatase A [Candidatus Omnitrophota bacterium]|nr:phosphatidylglycerophosphatase A [Candidatus Omnitrophota bacterium]
MNRFDRLCTLIASVFYIGYFPVAPGSMGSFAALFLYYFVRKSPELLGISIVACFFLGILTSQRAEKVLGRKDSGEIIIDEFTGMLLSLYLLPPTIGYVVAAFVLFRFFDIVKPKPINKLEKLPGSWGVMLDDLMAGVYANLILRVVWMVTVTR